MSETRKAKTVSFADASGRIQADFSLDDMVGKKITVKSYVTEKRTMKGNETQICYITTAEGKVGYTWSGVIARQLEDIKETLAHGDIVEAKVVSKQGEQGHYLSLE